MHRIFEWGAVIASSLPVFSTVPRHCACLTYFLHPKWRKINAVPITSRLIPLPLRRLQRARNIPKQVNFKPRFCFYARVLLRLRPALRGRGVGGWVFLKLWVGCGPASPYPLLWGYVVSRGPGYSDPSFCQIIVGSHLLVFTSRHQVGRAVSDFCSGHCTLDRVQF